MKYIYEVHGRNHDQIFSFDLEFEVEFSTFSSKVVLPTKATKLIKVVKLRVLSTFVVCAEGYLTQETWLKLNWNLMTE